MERLITALLWSARTRRRSVIAVSPAARRHRIGHAWWSRIGLRKTAPIIFAVPVYREDLPHGRSFHLLLLASMKNSMKWPPSTICSVPIDDTSTPISVRSGALRRCWIARADSGAVALPLRSGEVLRAMALAGFIMLARNVIDKEQ